LEKAFKVRSEILEEFSNFKTYDRSIRSQMMKSYKITGFSLTLAVIFFLGIGGAVSNASAAYFQKVQIVLSEPNMSLTHTTQGWRDRSWIDTDPAVADLPLWWSLDGGTTWNLLYDIDNEQPVPNFGPLGNAAGDILTIAACGQQTDPPTPLIPGGDVSPTSSTEINIAWDEYHGSGTFQSGGGTWTLDLADVVTTLSVSGSGTISVFPIPLCEGDFDSDGDVDENDLAAFGANFGKTACSGDGCKGDFNVKDNDIDGSDLAIFIAEFGRTDCL
jgi:hypothetical protein